MMKAAATALLVLLAGATGASAQDGNAAQHMVKPLTVQHYLRQAKMADMFEVRASRIALKRAQRPEAKDFAQAMLRDHEKVAPMVDEAAANQKAPGGAPLKLPRKLDQQHAKLIRELRDVKEADFDSHYLDIQVQALQDSLNLHRSYARAGAVPAVRDTAHKIFQILEPQLEKVQRLTGAAGHQ